jgi:hypothetical protein
LGGYGITDAISTSGGNITGNLNVSGLVGVGTTSPATKLDVNGVITSSGTTDKSIAVQSGTNNYAYYGNFTNFAIMGVNRNPSNGNFADINKASADIAMLGDNGSSYISFETTNTNNSTPSERMRITGDGNVGIGTTSPTFQSGGGLVVYRSDVARIELKTSTTGDASGDGAGLAVDGTNTLYVVNKENAPISFYTNNAERMRIDSAGNVGIGTTSPASYGAGYRTLALSNTDGAVIDFMAGASRIGTIYTDTTYTLSAVTSIPMRFMTNDTERMRITSTGNVGIGTTNPIPKLYVEGAMGTDYVAQFNNLTTSGNLYGIASTFGTSGNNTNSWHFVGVTADVGGWFLYGNGTTSYSSDQRLKKNIQTTRDGYLEDLMKLRVVKYNWKASKDGTPKELGLIAQEVEKVFPGLIQEHDVLGVGTRKNIKHSVMEFILIKAIQELKKELDAMKSKMNMPTEPIEPIEPVVETTLEPEFEPITNFEYDENE